MNEWDVKDWGNEADALKGDEWERRNRQLELCWALFTHRLEVKARELEAERKRRVSPDWRSKHIEAFRAKLEAEYGTSYVDPVWQADKRRKLEGEAA